MAALDIETSGGPDLKLHGLARYFASQQVRLACAYYKRFDQAECIELDAAKPAALHGLYIYAHNAEFDRRGLEALAPAALQGRIGWGCTMGLARALNVPGALGNACRFLFGPDYHKTEMPDEDGLDADEALREYCRNDVRITERLVLALMAIHKAAHEAVGDDAKQANKAWRRLHREIELNARINRRGLPIDEPFLAAANARINELHAKADEMVPEITGGLRATDVRKIIDWLRAHPSEKIRSRIGEGYGLDALRRLAFASKHRYKSDLWDEPIDPSNPRPHMHSQAQAFAQMVIDRNYKSLVKYRAIAARILRLGDNHHRYYDAYAYNAQHSGRFSSYGAQFHNFPRPDGREGLAGPYDCRSASCWTLSRCLRRLVRARPGHVLVTGDLKAIELRVLLHLAGRGDAIAGGRDIYKEMAARIFSKSPDDVSKDERHIGKSAVLGLGYGMGAEAFAAYAKVNANLAIKAVGDYAEMLPEVGLLRDRLFDAWKAGGGDLPCGIKAGEFEYEGRRCKLFRLPSGRSIIYWDCGARNSYDNKSHKPARLFAGSATAHVVSGMARDVLAAALAELDAAFRAEPRPRGRRWQDRMRVIGHIHDEIIAEVPEYKAKRAEAQLRKAMTSPPSWLPGIELGTETMIAYDWMGVLPYDG